MTSKPRSEQELKPPLNQSDLEREHALSKKLITALEKHTFREIGRRTGYHAETVRRYLNGSSKIPADFVGQVCRQFVGINANDILGTTIPNSDVQNVLRRLSTQELMAELGRRIELIEDNTISKILLSEEETDFPVPTHADSAGKFQQNNSEDH